MESQSKRRGDFPAFSTSRNTSEQTNAAGGNIGWCDNLLDHVQQQGSDGIKKRRNTTARTDVESVTKLITTTMTKIIN